MVAVKENKEYTVDESTKQSFLTKGYNIYDEKGKLIERAKTSTVSFAEYEKALKRIKELEAELDRLKKKGE